MADTVFRHVGLGKLLTFKGDSSNFRCGVARLLVVGARVFWKLLICCDLSTQPFFWGGGVFTDNGLKEEITQ